MPCVLVFLCMLVFVSVPEEHCVKVGGGGGQEGVEEEGVSGTVLLTKEHHSAEASS